MAAEKDNTAWIALAVALVSLMVNFWFRFVDLPAAQQRKGDEQRAKMRNVAVRALVLWTQYRHYHTPRNDKLGKLAISDVEAVQNNARALEDALRDAVVAGLWETIIGDKQDAEALYVTFVTSLTWLHSNNFVSWNTRMPGSTATNDTRRDDPFDGEKHPQISLLWQGLLRLLDRCALYESGQKSGGMAKVLRSAVQQESISNAWENQHVFVEFEKKDLLPTLTELATVMDDVDLAMRKVDKLYEVASLAILKSDQSLLDFVDKRRDASKDLAVAAATLKGRILGLTNAILQVLTVSALTQRSASQPLHCWCG
jgi:hypothetical protein